MYNLARVSVILIFIIQFSVARKISVIKALEISIFNYDSYDDSKDNITDFAMRNSVANSTENSTNNHIANCTANSTKIPTAISTIYPKSKHAANSTANSTVIPTTNSTNDFKNKHAVNSTANSTENPSANSTYNAKNKNTANFKANSTEIPTTNSTNDSKNKNTANYTANSTENPTVNSTDNFEMECKLTEMPPAPNSMCCGVDVSTTNRIGGGSPTSINQYPWMALIEYETKENWLVKGLCAGSLISSQYVLTAAHCVSGDAVEDKKPKNIILGDYDRYHDGADCIKASNGEEVCSAGEIKIAIENVIPHNSYFERTRTLHGRKLLMTSGNDIALIKIAKSAPYTDAIRPICLPTSNLNMNHHANLTLVMAGWGRKTPTSYSNVKRYTSMPYVSLEDCNVFRVSELYHICAGGIKGHQACSGDSGGPLMINNDGQYELAGVISLGSSCDESDDPVVSTNVHKYIDWIGQMIKENE